MSNSHNDPFGSGDGVRPSPPGGPPPGYQYQGYPPPPGPYQAHGQYPPPPPGPYQAHGQYPPHPHFPPMQAYGPYAQLPPQKSRIAAALLAFFLGVFGAHNFYLGHTSRGVTQLVLYLVGWALSIVVIGLWAFIEFILLLVGARGYDRDASGYPLS